MKRFAVVLLVLALAYPVGWAVAEEKQSVESLKVDLLESQIQAVRGEINARMAQIREKQAEIRAAQNAGAVIEKLSKEIAVWQNEEIKLNNDLNEARKVLKKIQEVKKQAKPKKKP